MSRVLIPDVQIVTVQLAKSHPPKLLITATGEVPTGGWSKPELANFSVQRDGTLLVDFLIEPPAPNSMVSQAFQNHSATATYDDPAGVLLVSRVRINGANGDWAEVSVDSGASLKAEVTTFSDLPWPPRLPRPFPWPMPQPLPLPIPPIIKPPRPPLLIVELKGYVVRLIRPGDVITADFRSDRVNFYLAADGRIDRHSFF